jgi:hypothetical protein
MRYETLLYCTGNAVATITLSRPASLKTWGSPRRSFSARSSSHTVEP